MQAAIGHVARLSCVSGNLSFRTAIDSKLTVSRLLELIWPYRADVTHGRSMRGVRESLVSPSWIPGPCSGATLPRHSAIRHQRYTGFMPAVRSLTRHSKVARASARHLWKRTSPITAWRHAKDDGLAAEDSTLAGGINTRQALAVARNRHRPGTCCLADGN